MPNSMSFDLTICILAQTISSLEKLIHLTQSKYNIPTCDVANPISIDIIHVVILQHVEVPCLKTYKGKGDHVIHVKTFQTICNNYTQDYRLMAKLFLHTFRDRALQWYFYLPPYSIDPFQTLADVFIQ